jgi:hypothetical protein
MPRSKEEWVRINKEHRLMLWNLLLQVTMWGGYESWRDAGPQPEEA